MARLLKVMLILSFLAVLSGCGQKGDLYLPSEQVAHYLGL